LNITVLLVKGAQALAVRAYQYRRAALREAGGKDFLVAVAQALAAVDHERALALRLFQYVGRVDVFVVEGRVLAHQDDVELREVAVLVLAQRVPALRIMEYFQRGHARPGHPLLEVEVLLFHVKELPIPGLRSPQHGEGAVLFVIDVGDRVHHHTQLQCHGLS
jgi:hypothetical protein